MAAPVVTNKKLGLTDVLEQKLSPIAQKFGAQRHVAAIREAFLSVIAFIIVGAFITVLRDAPVVSNWMKPLAPQLSVALNLTFGIIGLYLAFSVAYNLSVQYEVDPMAGGLMGVMAYLFAAAPQAIDNIPFQFLGSPGIILAVAASIFAVEVYRLCMQHGIYIKAPEAVPPAVTRFFVMLVPELLIIAPVWLISTVWKIELGPLVLKIFGSMSVLMDTYTGGIIMDGILNNWTWWLGIHPFSALGPLYIPFLTSNSMANAQAFAAGDPMPFVQTLAWWTGYKTGGTGSTIPLVFFAMMSRSKRLKALGAVSLIPVLLHINEPLLFGLPIILNPIWFIPFGILQPILSVTVSMWATKVGLVAAAHIPFMGFMPGPIAWYLGTLDWRAIPWGFITGWIIPAIVYYPFWRVYERTVLREEGLLPELSAGD
ncbi:MAG: PTS sugar transporter subunit IIC [Bacillota bacterium]